MSRRCTRWSGRIDVQTQRRRRPPRHFLYLDHDVAESYLSDLIGWVPDEGSTTDRSTDSMGRDARIGWRGTGHARTRGEETGSEDTKRFRYTPASIFDGFVPGTRRGDRRRADATASPVARRLWRGRPAERRYRGVDRHFADTGRGEGHRRDAGIWQYAASLQEPAAKWRPYLRTRKVRW